VQPADEEIADVLRDRLLEADRDIEPPDDLWERIRTPVVPPRPADHPSWRRPRLPRLAVVAVTVVAMCAAVVLALWLGDWSPRQQAQPSDGTVRVTVYNAERACRPLHTLECSLRLARDPHARYAAADNVAGRVWHGDRVQARCVVTDGTLVTDEAGVSSARWYLVTTAEGIEGWLPGVRTRNQSTVRVCRADEVRRAVAREKI
jgi:hypothetical protein